MGMCMGILQQTVGMMTDRMRQDASKTNGNLYQRHTYHLVLFQRHVKTTMLQESEGHEGHVDIQQHSLGGSSLLNSFFYSWTTCNTNSTDTTQSQPY